MRQSISVRLKFPTIGALGFCRLRAKYKMMSVRRLGEQTRSVGITYDKRTAIEGESVARAAASISFVEVAPFAHAQTLSSTIAQAHCGSLEVRLQGCCGVTANALPCGPSLASI